DVLEPAVIEPWLLYARAIQCVRTRRVVRRLPELLLSRPNRRDTLLVALLGLTPLSEVVDLLLVSRGLCLLFGGEFTAFRFGRLYDRGLCIDGLGPCLEQLLKCLFHFTFNSLAFCRLRLSAT